TVLGVQVREHLRDLGTEYAQQRELGHLYDADVSTRAAGRGRDLEADPTRSDDHEAPARPERRPDRVGVLAAAQVQDAVGAGAGQIQRAGGRAGCEQQLVVRQGRPVGERDLVRGGVDRGRVCTEAKVDVVFVVPLLAQRDRVVERAGAGQVALGQRRPFVRQVRFVTDERQAAFVAVTAQRFGRLRTGQAAA